MIKHIWWKVKLRNNKLVLEFRDPSWWKEIKTIANIGIVCSVDAPNLPNTIINTNDVIYLRLHGSKEWYNYVYSKRKLDSILSKMEKLKASKKAIYLNNDHGMLKNGVYLLEKIQQYRPWHISKFWRDIKPGQSSKRDSFSPCDTFASR